MKLIEMIAGCTNVSRNPNMTIVEEGTKAPAPRLTVALARLSNDNCSSSVNAWLENTSYLDRTLIVNMT